MENSESMLTMSQLMKILTERKITKEWRMNEYGEMKLDNSEKKYLPEELKILKTYRFEGDSNPDDNAVLYVAEDIFGNKGMIIDSYGADSNYSGREFDDFIRNIPTNDDSENTEF